MKITATQDFLDPTPVDPKNQDKGEYTLRFTAGQSYDVPADRGQYFVSQGWADNAASDAKLSEPFDTRKTTDKEAARLEREVHQPARDRATVTTTRFRGTGPNEIVPDGQSDGAEVVTLEVADAESSQGGGF